MGGRITIAIAIILLVGSLIANGCLYSQLGSYSFAIGGSGGGLGLILILMGCSCKTVTIKRPGHTSAPQRQENRELPVTVTQKPEEVKIEPPVQIPQTVAENEPTISPPLVKQPLKQESLPPMPPIFGIQLAPDHTLLTAMSTIRFLKPEEKKNTFTFAFGAALAGDDVGEELFGDYRFDSDLLNFPLASWVHNHETFIKDPQRKENVTAIDERVAYLEQLIQLKERLKRFPPATFRVRDLLGNWLTLKCRFMSEEEFTNLTVASVAQESDPVAVEKILGQRIRALSKAMPDFTPPVSFDKQSVDAILLRDLPKIQAAHINADAGHFPLLTFLLMDLNEVKKIDLNGLTEAQLKFVFSKTYVKNLTSQQINSSISKIKDLTLFAHLSDDQKVDFDFSKITDLKERKKAFGVIFDTRAKEVFDQLDLKRIYEFIPLFELKHWRALSQINKHVVAVDFTKWKPEYRKEVFELVFDGNISACFEMLELTRIYELLPWFEYKHWSALKEVEKHVISFDFSQIADIELRKRVFGWLYNDKYATERFAKLPLSRIYEFLPWFENTHWFALRDAEAHVLAFDYSRIDTIELRKTVFAWFYNDKHATERFAKLPLSRIYEFLPWFENTHWFALGDLEAHVLAFDYSRIDTSIRERICSWWFRIKFGDDSKAAKWLPQLQPGQKDQIRDYVDKQLLKYLN